MSGQSFIVREPLLDPSQRVLGFQLSWHGQKQEQDEAALSELMSFVADELNDETNGYLLGDSLIFLEAVPALLQAQGLLNLSAKNTVLIFSKRYFGNQASLDAIKELRNRGFGICLRNADVSALERSFFPLITHMEVLFNATNLAAQAKMYAALKQSNVQMVARNVATWPEFEACSALGLCSFVGKLHLTPRPNAQKGLNTTQTTILQLMEMIRKNADVAQLETVVKRDPALAYKLLRYINSAGFGLRTEVQSLKHAVTILGYSPLYRWLSLLLATASAGGSSPVLLETAIVRGRFAELLGQSALSKSEAENLFVAGMFSLLDRLIGLPMQEVLASIQLPDAVVEALISRGGVYGPYLALAEACELNSMLVSSLAENLKISTQDLNQAHLSALVWAKNIATAS